MKVGIVGSRDYSSYVEVANIVTQIRARYPDAVIVSGGRRGVDTWAATAAQTIRLETREFKVVEVREDRLRAGQFFVSYQFQLPDGGAGINPLVNNRTGEGFHRSFAAAAHWRNERIAREVDVLVAFWDGRSSGTRSTIRYARDVGTLVCVLTGGMWVP